MLHCCLKWCNITKTTVIIFKFTTAVFNRDYGFGTRIRAIRELRDLCGYTPFPRGLQYQRIPTNWSIFVGFVGESLLSREVLSWFVWVRNLFLQLQKQSGILGQTVELFQILVTRSQFLTSSYQIRTNVWTWLIRRRTTNFQRFCHESHELWPFFIRVFGKISKNCQEWFRNRS